MRMRHEQIAYQASHLFEPYTLFLVPILVMPLAVFVAFVQTLVFTLLSMIYISEVSHPADDHEDHSEPEENKSGSGSELATAAAGE